MADDLPRMEVVLEEDPEVMENDPLDLPAPSPPRNIPEPQLFVPIPHETVPLVPQVRIAPIAPTAPSPHRYRGAGVYEIDDSYASYVLPLVGAFALFTLVYYTN